MPLKVKNWKKFQHFNDRRPVWIKLYKEILDDFEVNKLKPEAFKFLVQIWLVASEDPKLEGWLPDINGIAFRLRLARDKVISLLEQIDIFLISESNQIDMPRALAREETEKRREETEATSAAGATEGFEDFWEAYPKKVSMGQAEKTWRKIKPGPELRTQILDGLKRAKVSKWASTELQFIPNPSTWLNAKGWLDQLEVKTKTLAATPSQFEKLWPLVIQCATRPDSTGPPKIEDAIMLRAVNSVGWERIKGGNETVVRGQVYQVYQEIRAKE